MMSSKPNPLFKSGYVAIVGLPNAGKSTLMNSLLKERLAIVTPKPQTTRHQVLGILNHKKYQLILLDTPGLLTPRYLMHQKMMDTCARVIRDADVVLVLADMTRADKNELLYRMLLSVDQKKILALNKADLFRTALTDKEIRDKARQYGCREGLVISAKSGQGLDRLIRVLLKYMPAGLPFYPQDQLSDEPERFFVSEIIREQIFMKYGEEIPYAAGVQITQFKERKNRKDYIQAVITVERDSQKAILIGREGQSLKELGVRARQGIERFLSRSVYLELHVRVRKKWRKDPGILKQMGFT
ncbi:GTPase Era [bacterium]|nr:GTPase Era [bacterium]